jgi:hypothetical protein
MRLCLRACVAAGILFTAAAPASAQARKGYPFEIGVDGSITQRTDAQRFGPGSETVTSINLPVDAVRFGVFMNDQLEIEPSLGYQRDSESGRSFSQTNFAIGLPIYFSPDRTKTQIFVRPVVGLLKITDVDGTQVNVGAGLGVKLPIDPRLAGRFEFQYLHGNRNGDLNAYGQFGLLIGLSAYTL